MPCLIIEHAEIHSLAGPRCTQIFHHSSKNLRPFAGMTTGTVGMTTELLLNARSFLVNALCHRESSILGRSFVIQNGAQRSEESH